MTTTTREDWANLIKELCWQLCRLAWYSLRLVSEVGIIVALILYLTGHLAVRYIP